MSVDDEEKEEVVGCEGWDDEEPMSVDNDPAVGGSGEEGGDVVVIFP